MKKIVAMALLGGSMAFAGADDAVPAYLDERLPIEQRVEDALARMTREEKVALCHAQGKFSSAGVPRLGIPELWMSDGPHGVRAEVNWNDWGYANWANDYSTAFPALTALAATWNPQMAALYGRNIGEEARYREKDVLLGPGVNIYRTPLNGRNFEYMGEDPYLAGEMAVPYIQELQKNGVAACVKHFALNNQETWRGNVDVRVSDRALYEIYLPAFKKAVTEGKTWSIMGAYNQYDGQHACHNSRLLCDILRGEWGFDGAVISDWGGTHDTRQAALNGLDIEMGTYTNGLTSESEFTCDDYYLANPYLKMLESGELPDSSVNAKAANVLRLIFRTAMNSGAPRGSLDFAKHYAAAKRIADESIVLLKNDGLLPLRPDRYKRVLVVGENAVRNLTEGGGSSELKVKDMFTPLDALKEVYAEVLYAPGYKSGRPIYDGEEPVAQDVLDSFRREAVAMAKDVDAVIFIGGLNKNGFQDTEGTDRREYSLPWGQDRIIEELCEANPNVVVANVTGNAYSMPWIGKVPAVMQSWYLGTMIGPAMADAISGKVNPSGKMPYSIPRRLEDCAAHSFGQEAYPGVESPGPRQEYREDILVGYRWHDTKSIPALFPFGHGLSYTKFEYGKPTASAKEMTDGAPLVVRIPITNAGGVEGSEVVQLYVSDLKSTLPRPLKELKGFSKISLKPGETGEVEFRILPEHLQYFDDAAHQWVAEPGKFMLLIGSSSTDIRAKVPFTYK